MPSDAFKKSAWVFLFITLGFSVGLPHSHAQTPDDWTHPYRPAMLLAYTHELAGFSAAPRYTLHLNLDITPEEARVSGHQTVLYTNQTGTPLSEIVFRLYPNLNSYGGTMDVSGITVNEVISTPQFDTTRSILTVPLSTPLAPGSHSEIGLDFTVTIAANRAQLYAQFSYLDGILSLPNVHPMLAVYEPGAGWWQITDHPQGEVVFSETAFYTVSITAPANLILATSGSEVDLVANPDGTLTHRYVAPLMRDFALFASTNYVTVSGEQDGIRLTVYYDPATPGGEAAAREGLRVTGDSVRIFNATFGPYPFAELDVVQSPNTAGGMEYPGLFAMSSNIWDKADPTFGFLVVHETAHQWFYSLVGNDQALHPWLDEALAQYAVAVYIRHMEGAEAYQAALGSFRALYEAFIVDQPDQRIGEPVTAYPGQAYFYLVYQKGPLLFAALDDAYGYDAVLRLLRAYGATYRYRIATPEGALTTFESTLGADLHQLFAEWISDAIPVG